MSRINLILLMAGTIFGTGACTSSIQMTGSPRSEMSAAEWDEFGDGVTLEERTDISNILANPDEYVGQTVAVEGRVTSVCAMMGCWVELESDSKERLRVKVEDGVIVFPQDAQGKPAVAQGKVEVLEYSREEFVEKTRHEAEELGHDFDPSSIGEPPYREIRLWGSGALIAKDLGD